MKLSEFIQENRVELEKAIADLGQSVTRPDDEDIKDWIMDDEALYRWAIQSGVSDI